MKNKLPTLVSPIAPDLRQFLNRMREAFESPEGLLTRDDLVKTGVFEANTTGGLDFLEPGEAQSCIAPPAPIDSTGNTTLEANGAMTSVILTWDNEPYASTPCYAYAEVWRASSDNLGSSVLIGTTSSSIYADAVGSDASNYYWIRFVNVLNDKGPFVTSGVAGATSPDVAYLLSQLTTSITNGQLASTLAASINSTFHQNDAPTAKADGTTLVAGDVWIDANGNDAVSIYNGSAWVSAAVATQAYVGNEITQQVGYCERTVTSSGAKNVATAYTTKATCEAASVSGETFAWKDDVALAGEVKTVTTTADGNTTTVSQHTSSINGIQGKHTVKIDNAGHLSGYGLISTNNDATPTAEFGIRADNFWVAPPAISASSAPTTDLYKGKVWVHSGTGAVQYYSGSAWGTTPTTLPFIVKTTATTAADGNTIPAGVYMEDAYIQNSSIVTAKIGNAAVDTLQVADAAIKEAKIDNLAVTTAKIDDLAVTNAKVTALNAAKITAGTLDANRIGAGTIDATKLKITGTGAIVASSIGALGSFYQDNIPTSLAIGDLWVDTDDNNKLYRAASVGADAITAGEWVTVQDGTIAAAQDAADEAKEAADDAQEDATAATTTLTHIASDEIITPSEKLQAKTLWEAITSERGGIVAAAAGLSVPVSSAIYTEAYDNLNTYLNTTETVFADMSTNTTLTNVPSTPTVTSTHYTFNAGSSNGNSVAFDPNMPGKFVVVYSDGGNSDYGTAIVGTVSGTAITYGSEYVFNSGSTGITDVAVAFDPNTAGKFVVVFKDSADSNKVKAIVGTVSGTAISYGSTYTINSGSSLYITFAFDPINSNKFVVAYTDAGNSYVGTAVVGTISGTAISVGSEYVFHDTSLTGGYSSKAYHISLSFDPNTSGKFIITYQDYHNATNYIERLGIGIVGTISGTAISYGSKYGFTTYATTDTSVAFDPDYANKFVVAYRDSSGDGAAKVGTISGTTISYGSQYEFDSSEANDIAVAFDSNNDNNFVIGYSGSLGFGYIIVGAINGTAISFGTRTSLSISDSSNKSISFDPNTYGRFVFTYKAPTNGHGKAVICTNYLSERSVWDNEWVMYYTAKQTLLDEISGELNSISETIKGNVYYSDTTEIDGGKIRADTVTVNEVNLTPSDIGVGSSATSGARMNITSTTIKIYDANNLRVHLGDLS